MKGVFLAEAPKHFVAPQHKFNIKMGRYVAGIIVGPMAVLVGVVARLVHLQAVPEGIIAAVQARPAVLLLAGGVQGRPPIIPAMFVKIISGFLKI